MQRGRRDRQRRPGRRRPTIRPRVRTAARVTAECQQRCGVTGYLDANKLAGYHAFHRAFDTAGGDDQLIFYDLGRAVCSEPPAAPDATNGTPHATKGTVEQFGPTTLGWWQSVLRDREQRTAQALHDAVTDGHGRVSEGFETWNRHLEAAGDLGEVHAMRLASDAVTQVLNDIGDPELHRLCDRLAVLQGLLTARRWAGPLLAGGSLSVTDAERLPGAIDRLCDELRPDLPVLEYAFAYPDELVRAPLAAPDYNQAMSDSLTWHPETPVSKTDTTSILHTFRLDGALALVTGASRGIGKAVAVALAEAGAHVAVAARTVSALEDTVRAVEARGREAVPVTGDLSVSGTATWITDQAAGALGGLDIVIHNAGVLPFAEDGLTPLMVPFKDSTQSDWDSVLAVNLNATAELCRAAYPYLAESDRASLVLMSSLAGVIAAPMMEAYAASKAGQVSLARSLAVAWAREGIRVNALCPGWIRTDLTEFAAATEPVSDWLMGHIPMGRWGDVAEVASAAVFLAAPASSLMTGHALLLDGGASVPDSGLAGIPKPPSPFIAPSP